VTFVQNPVSSFREEYVKVEMLTDNRQKPVTIALNEHLVLRSAERDIAKEKHFGLTNIDF